MSRRFVLPATLLASVALAAPAASQIVASESATVTQTISGTEFEVRYSRPSLRGRGEIFGGVTPVGETWTGGANHATELHLSKAVLMGGVEVPAGAYTLWWEVAEGTDWRLMLHEDTTLWHTPHIPVDEDQIVVPATRSQAGDTLTTLRYDFEDVRWDGARLVLAWGAERLSVPIEVDAGITLDVPADQADRYTGRWMYEDAASRPAAEQIEAMLSTPDLPDINRRYFVALRDVPTEREVQIVYDAETGRLYRTDAEFAALWSEFLGLGEGDPRFELLVPRGEGFFAPTVAVGGQLLSFDPTVTNLMEFEFDEDGRAIRFEVRNADGEVQITGERVGGDR